MEINQHPAEATPATVEDDLIHRIAVPKYSALYQARPKKRIFIGAVLILLPVVCVSLQNLYEVLFEKGSIADKFWLSLVPVGVMTYGLLLFRRLRKDEISES